MQNLCNPSYFHVWFTRYIGKMICTFSGGLGPRTPSKNSIWGNLLVNINSIVFNLSNYILIQLSMLLIWKDVKKMVQLVVEDWAQVALAKK